MASKPITPERRLAEKIIFNLDCAGRYLTARQDRTDAVEAILLEAKKNGVKNRKAGRPKGSVKDGK